MSECRQAPTVSSAVNAPTAWAASSMIVMSSPTAARISAIGSGNPVKCTGTTAFVRSVSAAESVCALTFHVAGSMSAKRGVAPT